MKRRAWNVTIFFFFFFFFFCIHIAFGVQILSKSKLEKCEKTSDSNAELNCTRKIVLNMAVPSGSSGGEASIVAEIVEVEENSTQKMQNLRIPPVLTVNKSSAYAIYELTYLRDVSYKPEEYYVKTRKCEPDATEKVVKVCERLRDENGHIMEHTEPICCPCGPQRRLPSSCGNFVDKWMKGKPNTAHCVRFPGDWFHVFSIGQRSLGFSVKIQVKTGSKISEVFLGPDNRTATSSDNFLRVNLIGDFAGYTNIPSFEDFYLVIPRQGGPGQPESLGGNFSMWMLLERLRFTLDGLECNKIGVGFEAFSDQPSFCSSPFWSCLHNQLWNFWEADQNRIKRKQLPLYGVEGRFERINQHPNAGTHSFSIGVTEVLNTNLLIELSADDIDYVFQRSPGKILSINIPAFEALSQSGVATVTAKNTGEVEASYSLTFDCSREVTLMEEQYFILKPEEVTNRSFKLYPGTDQSAKYVCAAILKDSDYNQVDKAECQFSTTSTVLENGTQINPLHPSKHGIAGFFESIAKVWNELWNRLIDFITGNTCRNKCYGFFDFKCHIQYICMSWLVTFGLFLAIIPTVIVLLWLLHQKGLFDMLYDCWEDHCWSDEERRKRDFQRHRNHHYNKHRHRHHNHHHHNHHHHRHRVNVNAGQRRRRSARKHDYNEKEGDLDRYLHRVSAREERHNQQAAYGEEIMTHGNQRKEREKDKGVEMGYFDVMQ